MTERTEKSDRQTAGAGDLRHRWRMVHSVISKWAFHSPLRQRLARGTLWSLAGAVVGKCVGFLTSVASARLLGKIRLGEYAMAQSTAAMLTQFGTFGTGWTSSKYVAETRDVNADRTAHLMAASILIASVSGMLAAIAHYLAAGWLATHVLAAPHLAPVLRVASILVWLNSYGGAQNGILTGFEAFRAAALLQSVLGATGLPLIVAGAYYAGVRGATVGLVLSTAITTIAGSILVHAEARRRGISLVYLPRMAELSEVWSFSIPSLLTGLLCVPPAWAVGALFSRQPDGYGEVGVFNVAVRWRDLLQFLPTMVSGVALPIMAQLFGTNNRSSFRRVAGLQVLLNVGLVAAMVMAMLPFAGPLMGVFGQGFAGHFSVLVLALLTAIPIALTNAVATVVMAAGKAWWTATGSAIWGATLLAATPLAVHHGAAGLAACYLTAYVLTAGWYWHCLSRLSVASGSPGAGALRVPVVAPDAAS